MTTRRLMMIAVAIAVTFVQEQMFLLLPNIQLTVLLMFVFVSVFTYKESLVYIIGYVLLDNLYMGGFNLFYMIPMLFAWSLIPFAYHTVLRRTTNEMTLAFAAFVFGFVYGWSFLPFNMIQTGIDNMWVYLSADIMWEITMAVTGFVTVNYLFQPLRKTLVRTLESGVLTPAKSYK